MSQSRRQLALLALLLVALVYLAARELVPALQQPGAAVGALAAAANAGGVPEQPLVAELRLEDLQHRPATYSPGRNPFVFAPKGAPEPPPAPPAPPPPAAAPATRPAPKPRQPPAPEPPPVRFVYLGSFGQPGREIAVFSQDEELFNAFEGDVLEKEFVVRRIGFESADVGFVDFPDAPPKRLAIGG